MRSQQSLVDYLTKAFDKVDVLITSGGVSMGEKVCCTCVILCYLCVSLAWLDHSLLCASLCIPS